MRPMISKATAQQLHEFALREGRSMNSAAEIVIRAGLNAIRAAAPPPWAPQPTKPVGQDG
jgi:hypothetical protein